MSRRVVFLDRDGVINEEVGYLNHLDRLRLLPGSAQAIALLNQHDRRVVVVTNQSGAAHGYFPESLISEVHDELARRLEAAGARLDAIYYCPHHPTAGDPRYRQDCACRKPRTGMLERAARELEVDLEGCYIISDRYRDLEMAAAVGGAGILVQTGYGKGEYTWRGAERDSAARHVADDLLAAVHWLLARECAPERPEAAKGPRG